MIITSDKVASIGVASIFVGGGGKPQITFIDVIKNFEREIFVGAKISWNGKSEAVACMVLARN